jgi:translation initiation factor 3 subunit F
MRVHEQERSGIDLLTSNLTSLSATAAASSALTSQPDVSADLAVTTPLATLYGLLSKVSVMLDSVLEYVRAVAAGEREGDERVGRALLETVGVVPTGSVPKGKQGADAKGFEEDFNAHLADVLMVRCVSFLRWVEKLKLTLSRSQTGLVPRKPGQDSDGDQ